MKICICGGGSLGHVCAGVLSEQPGVEVGILSGHPSKWGSSISVTDLKGKEYRGRLARVSSDPAEVVVGADMVLLCLPGYLIEKTLTQIKPFVGDAVVGSIVSSNGFFFFAHEVLGPDAKLFGFQRSPFIARLVKYGASANLLGYKSSVSVAVENVPAREEFRQLIERLFLTPATLLDSFYEAALTNSNPILHTGRLYTMFAGREDEVFDHKILFYKEWTEAASQKLIDMGVAIEDITDKLSNILAS